MQSAVKLHPDWTKMDAVFQQCHSEPGSSAVPIHDFIRQSNRLDCRIDSFWYQIKVTIHPVVYVNFGKKLQYGQNFRIQLSEAMQCRQTGMSEQNL